MSKATTTSKATIKRNLPPFNPPYKREKMEVSEEVKDDIRRFLISLEVKRHMK